jgi:hypothetical protein
MAGFRLAGKQAAQYAQIGNAVPPLLARAVAEALLRALLWDSRRERPDLRAGAVFSPRIATEGLPGLGRPSTPVRV